MAETATEQQALDAYSGIVTSVAEKVLPSVASLRIGRGGRGFGGAGSGGVIPPGGFFVPAPPRLAARGAGPAPLLHRNQVAVDPLGAAPPSPPPAPPAPPPP